MTEPEPPAWTCVDLAARFGLECCDSCHDDGPEYFLEVYADDGPGGRLIARFCCGRGSMSATDTEIRAAFAAA